VRFPEHPAQRGDLGEVSHGTILREGKKTEEDEEKSYRGLANYFVCSSHAAFSATGGKKTTDSFREREIR